MAESACNKRRQASTYLLLFVFIVQELVLVNIKARSLALRAARLQQI